MDELMVLSAQRQAGKSTKALEWVAAGHRVPGYPGWSRVLLVPTQQRLLQIRRHTLKLSFCHSKDLGLEDFDHRVFSLHEWHHARVTSESELCIDDVDALIANFVRKGNVAAVTMTGRAWINELS